jgi:exodeoxyribonuclease III
MIVSTINVNGIRAAVKQRSTENLGLLAWLKETTADVVCLQETRADDEQLAEALTPALADGWHLASADPHIKGRNGVAVLSRHPITRVLIGPTSHTSAGAGDEFASHGRYLEVDTGDLTVASVYVPTGEADTDRQLEKERFMAAIAGRMAVLNAPGKRGAVVCGDWNIGHTESDIKAWKAQPEEVGLPAERAPVGDRPAGHRLGGRGPRHASRRGRPVQLVVVAGQGIRQRRGVADRLPTRQRRAGAARAGRPGRTARGLRAALVRPRTRDRRICGWPGVKVLKPSEASEATGNTP